MKGVFWNCREIRKKGMVSYVRDMLKEISLISFVYKRQWFRTFQRP
jgi:hypothetical protein